MELLPTGFGTWEAAGLVVFSYFTSAITAAFGLGGGVMMLAAMASTIPPIAVIPVHGAVQMGSNGGRAWIMRRHLNWSIFKYFIAGSLVGAAIASQVVIVLPHEMLRLILGLFVLWVVWAPKLAKREIGSPGFALVGIVTTFASMFVGATGLLIGAFMSPEKLGRMTTVSTHAVCAMVQHGLKLVVFGLLGFAFQDWVPLVIAMIATGFLGTYTGKTLLERLPEKVFGYVFKGLLTLLASRLVILAAMDLLGYEGS